MNTVFITWCVLGGLLKQVLNLMQKSSYKTIFSHILLCNLLTTLLRPNFEEPIDTAQQLLDNGYTMYTEPPGNTTKNPLSVMC